MSEREASASPPTIGLPQGELYRGDKIGSYEVLTQLSVGGMAELFLCFTQGPGGFRKFVVVKRILPDVKNNESYIKMFYDEARITSVLHHPNIAQVLDLGGEGDQAYIAMEFIAGQNLNQISSACLKRKKMIPLGLSVAVCRDICHALHYAHTIKDSHGRESPIIHRDVAQKNVMVTYEGAVKLLDFGIAKARGSLGKTTAGMVKGTTGYMSPEQVRGEALDGRSDVFCLGVVLFELLTGKRLFAAETETEEMERILAAPIPRPDSLQRKIPPPLVELVLKALARDRSQRFPTARAMAKSLDEVAGKWMYDQDRRATFMRDLFADRITATRRLLESAGRKEVGDDYRKAAHTLTEDAGAVFPELHQNSSNDADYLTENVPTAHHDEDTEDGSSTVVEPALQARPPPTVARSSVNRNFTPFTPVAPMAAATGGVVPRPAPSVEPGPGSEPVPEPEVSRAAARRSSARAHSPPKSRWLLRLLALAAVAGGVAATAWLRGAGAAPARPPLTPMMLPPAAAPPPPASRPEVQAGVLALTTIPPATVMEGAAVLGLSPLSGVQMSPGVHQLLLVAPDGTKRLLDVEIEKGQTTRVTVTLAQLPPAPPPQQQPRR